MLEWGQINTEQEPYGVTAAFPCHSEWPWPLLCNGGHLRHTHIKHTNARGSERARVRAFVCRNATWMHVRCSFVSVVFMHAIFVRRTPLGRHSKHPHTTLVYIPWSMSTRALGLRAPRQFARPIPTMCPSGGSFWHPSPPPNHRWRTCGFISVFLYTSAGGVRQERHATTPTVVVF